MIGNGQEPLRIAQVAPLWARVPPADYGGTELHVYWLTEELVQRGHEVTLYASGDSETSAKLKAIHPRNMLNAMEKGQAHTYEPYANALFAEVLKEAASYDVIHCYSELSHLPFATLSSTPVLYSPQTVLSIDDQWLLNRYNEVPFVAMSRSQVKDFPADHRPEIPIVYSGCDFDAFDFSDAAPEYLAFLGRMGPHKNPLGAIQIAKQVGWPLVLAGKPQDASEEAYFQQKIRPLIDGEHVRYIGPVDQVQKREFLKKAGALLFPIQWEEPFGIVMIEAMASGTPVVACRRGSVEEVVDRGLTGYYADAVPEMAPLVPKALALDRSQVRMHAKERFSKERMADDYVRQYRLIVNRRSSVSRSE